MNVTLSIDDALVKAARKVAAARGVSLNRMIREELERLTGEAGRAGRWEELERLLRDQPGRSHGWKWNRDELYDRPVLR